MSEIPARSSDVNQVGSRRLISTAPFVGLVIDNTTSLELGLNSLILGAKIDHDIDKISYAQIFFDNLNPQLADDIRWSEHQKMRVFIGYGNRTDRASYQGVYRMSNPKFGYGVDSNKITVSGLGDGVPMINVARRRVFESMTYSQIVSEIVTAYGYTLQSNVGFKETIPSLVQDGVSDYAFLKKLARMAGVDFFVWDSNVFFMNPALRAGVDPFIIKANSPAVKSLDFSVIGEGQAALVCSSPVDPMTGKSPLISTEYETDGVLDVDGGTTERFTRLARPTVIYKDATGSLLSRTALQVAVNAAGAQRKQIVKVNGVVSGTEQLMPRKLIVFAGCGSRFTGPFYITKVVHEITTQNVAFTTSFEAVRATTGTYRQDFGGDANSETVGGTTTPFMDASQLSPIAS